MVLRKPYAFLLKYFQKIHFVLLILCGYLFYKTTTLRTFVKDFIATQSYNEYIEPISHYINGFTYFVLFLIIVMTLSLIVLLLYKKKPWKVYIVPLIGYLFLFGIMVFVKSYFDSYDEYSVLTTIMAGRDLLVIAYFLQFPVFLILGVRFLGLDLNRFGFKEDPEYLEVKEEDREEFEINIEFDKAIIKRNFNRLLRNLRYLYFEHQLIFNTIFVLIVVYLIGYSYYYFGILHKTYKEGNHFTSNGYEIKVNKSYLTERKTNGDLIDEDSKYAYVIVNVTVKNLASARGIYIDSFHLMNRNKEAKLALQYSNYFTDFGAAYKKTEMKKEETRTFNLVYQVDKKLKASGYVLYYQNWDESLLIKKTKLKTEDLRDLTKAKEATLNEELLIGKEDVVFTDYKITQTSNYTAYRCDSSGCGIKNNEIASEGNYILELSFISDSLDVKSFVDFSTKYAKIKYEDKDGKKGSLNVSSVIHTDYTNNVLYLKVPKEIENYKTLELVYTQRNKQYLYHIK